MPGLPQELSGILGQHTGVYSTISMKVPTHKNRMNETPIKKYFIYFSPEKVT